MITKEEVNNAYLLFLGRPPENDKVIASQAKKYRNTAEIRQAFLNSPEFYSRNFRILMSKIFNKSRVPLNIEVDIKQKELVTLLKHQGQVWNDIGKKRPYYSVLSSKEYTNENYSRNKNKFENSGRNEVISIENRLKYVNLDLEKFESCLEFGCGVGRVTRFLAEKVRRVVGVDISKSHLEICREYLDKNGITNVSLDCINPSSDSLSIQGKYDFIYTRIVLQHNPPPLISMLLQNLLSSLNPEGIAMFQVVTYIDGYSWTVNQYLSKIESIDDQNLHVIPEFKVFQIIHESQCVCLSVDRDQSVTGIDKISKEFVVKKMI